MNDLGPIMPSDLSRHRARTLEVLKPWGMSGLWAHAGTRVPIEKISEAAFLAVQRDSELWAKNSLSYNLLGLMPQDMVDFDLDVRVKDKPSTRGPDWSAEDRAGADDMFRTFLQSLKTIEGFDVRSVFGRASLGGNGHVLIRIAPSEDMPDDIRRGRLAKLAFAVDLGWFTVKLEVRQSPRKKESRQTCVLPGSTYDRDYIKFYSLPDGPPGPHNSVLTPFPLEQVAKAIYRTAFLLSLSLMTNEGERHTTALLASGVLRREVEYTETEGEGGLNRDEARALFEELFADDPEKKARLKVFEDDFGRDVHPHLASYRALGERIGEGTANALKSMLHGQATDALDDMRQNLVFVPGSLVLDFGIEAGTRPIKLFTYNDTRNRHAEKTVQRGRKRVYLFDVLRNSPSRRQVEDTVVIPGVARGCELWEFATGSLVAEPPGLHLINRGAGWAVPYDDSPHPRRAEAEADLKTMLSWLTSKERDHEKIMQLWAFKAQNPIVKPQFAMGVYGGQGIGKNVVLENFPSHIFGVSVMNTTAKNLFGDRFQLQSALGSSLLIVNEVKDLGDFEMAKDLHRNTRFDIDVKYGEKGSQRLFCIPVYLSNESHPSFQIAGETDRTLYVVKAHTMQSLGCASLHEYEVFKMRRKGECEAMLAKLEDYDYCKAFMQIFMEYEVTQKELEDIAGSDSLSEEYRDRGLSPEQLALQRLLEDNCINTQVDIRPPLNLPFARGIFNDGFNYEYLKHAPGPYPRPLSNRKITQVLRECLGPQGELVDRRGNEGARVYYFPVKLGTLCDTFTRLTGGDIARDTKEHMDTGPYEPDQPTIRNRIDVFSRVDRGSKSF